MNNDDFDKINEHLLASLPYLTEIIFRDGKTYRKEYDSHDLEWVELDGGWREPPRMSGARLAAEYSEAKIWPGEHKNPNHKFVTGDRLDHLEAEANSIAERGQQKLRSAQTQDDLLMAKLHIERAEGMYNTLRTIRGYHEGINHA